MMASIQNKAFPLAGLMYANVNVRSMAERGENATNCDGYHLPVSFESDTRIRAHESKAGKTAPANAISSFPHRCDVGSFETSTRTCVSRSCRTMRGDANPQNLKRPEAESSSLLSIVMVQGLVKLSLNLTKPDMQNAVAGGTEGFIAVTTRGTDLKLPGLLINGEGEFSESIKKGLLTIANPVYGYSAPAKSGAGRGNPENIKATTDAYSVFFIVVMSVSPYSAEQIRTESMVALAGQLSGWPVSFVSGISTPVSVTTNHERGNSGGDSLKHTKEIIIMMTAPTQSQTKFIWLIAAVRRDMLTITAKIHHVAAETEREARRTLARDHVCFFAGRIRLEVAA